MPTFTIPLVGAMNARGYARSIGASAKDQQFINCLFESAQTEATQSSNLYCMKRAGSTSSVLSSGKTFKILQHDTADFSGIYSVDVSGIGHVYSDSTDLGIATPNGLRLADGAISGVTTLAWIDISANGWFLPKDAITGLTFTGDTHTNTTIDNISSMTGLYVGQAISGTNIAANTRIATINTAGSSITTTIATTGTTAGITVTREAIAKIISANWPNTVTQVANSIVYLDGIWFIGTQRGRIYNTAINDPSTIPADGFLTVDSSGSWISQIVKVGRQIVSMPSSRGGLWEWFVNSGNASGSPLSRTGITYYGGSSSDASTYYHGELYFVNSGTQSLDEVGLYKMSEGSVPVKVSDSIMDGILLKNSLFAVATITISGREMIGLFQYGGSTNTNSIIFDPITNNWQVLTITDGNISGMWRNFFTINNTDGKTFTLVSTNLFTDSNESYTMTIQTQNFYLNDGLPFIIDNINLIADTQSSGSVTLSSTADDYQSFGTIGSFNLTQPQKNIAGGGEYDSSVAFKLTDSGNNAFRAQALKISWRPTL